MAHLRVVATFIVAFALLAVLLVSWQGPRFIAWDNSVGYGITAQCICSETALLGAKYIISYQMRGCAVGAVLGAIAGIAFVVIRRKKAAATV
jgi:hypothetical protein